MSSCTTTKFSKPFLRAADSAFVATSAKEAVSTKEDVRIYFTSINSSSSLGGCQYFKYASGEVIARQQAQHKSEQTKRLMDDRNARMERIAKQQEEDEKARIAAKAERERLKAEQAAQAEQESLA